MPTFDDKNFVADQRMIQSDILDDIQRCEQIENEIRDFESLADSLIDLPFTEVPNIEDFMV
jgi:hypothetical protein